MKTYQMTVYRTTKTDDVLIAQITANWTPEDPDRFAWELGGDKIIIEELANISNPQQN